MVATCYGILIATLIYDPQRFNDFKWQWIDLPMICWCICPMFSSLTNDLGAYDGFSNWALNEVAVEKSARERMLEVVLEVEQRPLSSFGCDGVLVSTATGSTAYAFSAGGPVVWPNVDAFVVVPISAHALFSRPFVIDNDSSVAIEVLQRSHGGGVMSCDGRRTVELSPGARVEITRGSQSVEMVTLSDEPFADRLVRKFNLPVSGWRGPGSDD